MLSTKAMELQFGSLFMLTTASIAHSNLSLTVTTASTAHSQPQNLQRGRVHKSVLEIDKLFHN